MPESTFKYDVFLSHSSGDKPAVRVIATRLRDRGLSVWFDEWSVLDGEDINYAIEQAIPKSRVMVLCISSAAMGSDWVTLERSSAQFRDPMNKGRRLIPLLLEPSKLPDTIARLKYISYHSDPAGALDRLEQACMETPTSRATDARQEAKAVPSILFLDDEEITRKHFHRQLSCEYFVHLAASVDEALLLLKEKHQEIAVAFVDQRLPVRRGTDLLRVLRKEYPRIMRVMVSAYTEPDDLVDAINIGAVHCYLYKPWELPELRLIAHSAVEAFLTNETLPAFTLDLAPSKPSPAHSSKDNTANAASLATSRDHGVSAELDRQRAMVKAQEARVQEPEHIAFRSELQRSAESQFERVPSVVSSMMVHSVEPTIREVLAALALIRAMAAHDYSMASTFLLKYLEPKAARCLVSDLDQVINGLAGFSTQTSLLNQDRVVFSLGLLRQLITTGLTRGHQTQRLLEKMLGGSSAMKRAAKHFSVLAKYLGLEPLELPASEFDP